jgi:hypothetical protein
VKAALAGRLEQELVALLGLAARRRAAAARASAGLDAGIASLDGVSCAGIKARISEALWKSEVSRRRDALVESPYEPSGILSASTQTPLRRYLVIQAVADVLPLSEQDKASLSAHLRQMFFVGASSPQVLAGHVFTQLLPSKK